MSVLVVTAALIAFVSFVVLGVRALLLSEEPAGMVAGVTLITIALAFAVWFVLQG